MTFQFCTLRGPSSKLPVSSFSFWKFGVSNWQPSRLRHGSRSSADDSNFGHNSNCCNSLILRYRLLSSLPSLLRLSRPSSRASPFSDNATASQIGAAAWFVSAMLWFQVYFFAGQRARVNTSCGSLRLVETHITFTCCSHTAVALFPEKCFVAVPWPGSRFAQNCLTLRHYFCFLKK